MDMKNSALPRQEKKVASNDGGFKFYHLLIFAILGMLSGAYLSLNYLKMASPEQSKIEA
jgi:hypothetical protein